MAATPRAALGSRVRGVAEKRAGHETSQRRVGLSTLKGSGSSDLESSDAAGQSISTEATGVQRFKNRIATASAADVSPTRAHSSTATAASTRLRNEEGSPIKNDNSAATTRRPCAAHAAAGAAGRPGGPAAPGDRAGRGRDGRDARRGEAAPSAPSPGGNQTTRCLQDEFLLCAARSVCVPEHLSEISAEFERVGYRRRHRVVRASTARAWLRATAPTLMLPRADAEFLTLELAAAAAARCPEGGDFFLVREDKKAVLGACRPPLGDESVLRLCGDEKDGGAMLAALLF